MSGSGRPSYRLNLNRNPTQKWANAKHVDYGGDDWGDDDYDDYPAPEPQSAVLPQRTVWGPGNTAQRSFTNPMLTSGAGQPSFDREDERRHFSAAGYNPQQQAHPQQTFDSAARDHPEPPSLQVRTQTSGLNPQTASQYGTRRDQQTDAYGVPYSAPVAHVGDRFYSNIAAAQQASHNFNTPQTLTSGRFDNQAERSQRAPELPVPSSHQDLPAESRNKQPEHMSKADDDDTKPLPFIRPAEIYKRLEEEREKERLSQESSRPSIDSTTGRVRGDSLRSAEPTQSTVSRSQMEQTDVTRTPKSALSTVKEHKSDHNPNDRAMGHGTTPSYAAKPSSQLSPAMQDQQRPAFLSRASSSAQTDRTDPVSAGGAGEVHFPAVSTLENMSAAESLRRALHQDHLSSTEEPRHSVTSSTSDTGDLPNFEPTFTAPPRRTPSSNAIQLGGTGSGLPVRGSRSENLQHQPSLGYKSIVERAFDVEDHENLSPSNTTGTLPRINSASTAEISPIMSRRSDHGGDAIADLRAPSRTISEEPTLSHERNESIATVKDGDLSKDESILPATTFQPGFRRDKSPSTEEGAARRPLSVQIPEAPDAQQAILSTVTSSGSTAQDPTTVTLPATQYTPTPRGPDPPKQQSLQGDLAPTPTSRSTSEDWREWESQRRHFNAKHGIEDSNTVSPAMSASISRSESPAKGKVKDIADRLENNSAQSSTSVSTASETQVTQPSRPPQPRTANSRPSLPGAWMSDTTTVSSIDAEDSPLRPSENAIPSIDSRTTSTESVPTAVAPRNWHVAKPDTAIEAAFAAAAAAGNALAGSFSGTVFSRDNHRKSESISDEESETALDNTEQHNFSDTRDFASLSHNRDQSAEDDQDDAKTPRQSSGPDHAAFHGRTEEPIAFPAPLRTTRNAENRQPSPRLSIPPVSPVRDHEDSDPEQLQQDIVKSLTPKSSTIDESATRMDQPSLLTHVAHRDPSRDSVVSSDDDVLPQEYSSYWDEPATRSVQKESSTLRAANDLTPTAPKVVPEPNLASTTDPLTDSKPPFLEHRYSWEMVSTEHDKPLEPASSSNTNNVATTRASTHPQSAHPSSDLASSLAPTISRTDDLPFQGTTTSKPAILSSSQITNLTVSSTFPHERNDFRSILALKDSPSRIRGFDENRRVLAEPNGLLDRWLSSMKSPDHADVFSSSRLPQIQTTPRPNSKIATPQSDQTGTKQMQEDGKRLLAAAGKYGGKAGTAAKGLFARGKEKFRTTSAGDKVSLTTRQRSNTFESDTSPLPPTQRSTLPESAPQLPTPTLDTPPGESSWSTMFLDRPQPTGASASRSNPPTTALPSSTSALGTETGSTIAQNAAKRERPPSSVIAALPGNSKTTPSSTTLPRFDNAVKPGPEFASDGKLRGLDRSAVQDDKSASLGRESGQQQLDSEIAPSLRLPRERRPSSISDVSDVSPDPDDRSEVHPRNVSPTLENQPRQQSISTVPTQGSTKEAEAAQDRTSLSESTLPPYSSARNSTTQQKHSRAVSGSLIVPVADLKSGDGGHDSHAGSRPFSFFGSETLDHAQASQYQRTSETARSGTGHNALAETYGQNNDPKSPRVDITEHPAYRTSVDGRTGVEAVNPLPSSRRSPQEIELARQKQQQPQLHLQSQQRSDKVDEGYRIPGPYVQEYRSPRSAKPSHTQDYNIAPREDHGDRLDTPASGEASRPGETGFRAPPTSYSNQSRPEYDRNKSRSFGLFRSRSRSQTREQGQDFAQRPTQTRENSNDENKRRKGLFGFGNRTSSPVPQVNEGRDDVTARPDAGRGRKLSMDMLRSSAFGSKTQTDGKKKRSSGIGAFFGISGGRDKEDGRLERNTSATVSRGPVQTSDGYAQSPYQPQGPGFAVSDQQRLQATSPDPISQFPQPPTVRDHSSGRSESAYQTTQAYSTASNRQSDYDPANNSWSDTKEGFQTYDTAPNTTAATIPGASHPNHYMTSQEHFPRPKSDSPPVPVTRANKDISYGQDRPYVPPTSPRPQVASITEPKSEMANHVKNLHTRSRSPRLGRPPSDEFSVSAYDDTAGSSTTQKLSPDPTRQLGTFSNKKISPQGGVVRPNEDQEKPWTISLPDENESDRQNIRAHEQDRRLKTNTTGPGSVISEPTTASPTMSSHRNRFGSLRDIVSPVSTREINPPDTRAAVPAGGADISSNVISTKTSQGPERRDTILNKSQGGTSIVPHDPTVQFPAPPSISNSNVIPLPSTKSDSILADPARSSVITGRQDEAGVLPQKKTPQASNRILAERTTNVAHNTGSASSKPLTVAERVLGIQPAARGTMPEYRSTTPVPHSPAPSIGNPPKTSTWPETNPSTIAMTASPNGGTTVTKTTMTSGSKLQRGSIKTSTYVIDSNVPSRTGSKAGSDDSSIRNSANLRGSQRTTVSSQLKSGNELPLSSTTAVSTNPETVQKVDYGKSFDAVELPGSKPDGYESEEEIVMSATAYPGQEWMPDYAQGWED